MNKEELKEFLKENLNISLVEKSYGFNGRMLTAKLSLGDEVISEDYYTLKEDEDQMKYLGRKLNSVAHTDLMYENISSVGLSQYLIWIDQEALQWETLFNSFYGR